MFVREAVKNRRRIFLLVVTALVNWIIPNWKRKNSTKPNFLLAKREALTL